MKTISSGELAEALGGKLAGSPDVVLKGVESLENAQAEQLAFLGNRRYENQVAKTSAGVVIVPEDYDKCPGDGQAYILCENTNIAFAKAIEYFAPEPVRHEPGIHPAAVVAESAKIAGDAHVGACAVIDEHAEIGTGTAVCAGSYVGQHTRIGANCVIYQNVTIRERILIGDGVIIHSGTVVGSDGFGYEAGPAGIVKIPQVGSVKIDDEVEIGSNCSIDRARFGVTHLKQGVKIDNLVQVAHNVTVGECSMLIGQSGVAGSARIGRGVIVAAQAGINGHITIGDGAKIAGTAGVVKDVPPGGVYAGTPAETQREFMERLILPKKVRKLSEKVRKLEEKAEG